MQETELSLMQIVFGDFEHEVENTRKLLGKVPGEKLTWKPHDKSTSLGVLAQHVAHLPWFVVIAVRHDEYDLAGWKSPPEPGSTAEILALFEEQAAAARAALSELTPEMLTRPWTLRMGSEVYFTIPKAAVIRTFALSHLIHHRAQLTVYLRLLNIPVPGLYGPSADES